MLVAMRFVVRTDVTAEFLEQVNAALAALAARPGFLRGQCGRAFDDPRQWCLVTEWRSVGDYRRALSGYEVKVSAIPLLAQAVNEESAFETLLLAGPDAAVTSVDSDRAPEPESVPDQDPDPDLDPDRAPDRAPDSGRATGPAADSPASPGGDHGAGRVGGLAPRLRSRP